MIEDAEYRAEVLQQHAALLKQGEALHSAITSLSQTQKSSDAAVAASLDNMRMALMSALKIPVAAVMIAAVSWLFYASKITEHTWMIFCCVSLFPWFGDSIRLVVDILRPGANRDRVAAAAKLVFMAGVATTLSLTDHKEEPKGASQQSITRAPIMANGYLPNEE